MPPKPRTPGKHRKRNSLVQAASTLTRAEMLLTSSAIAVTVRDLSTGWVWLFMGVCIWFVVMAVVHYFENP